VKNLFIIQGYYVPGKAAIYRPLFSLVEDSRKKIRKVWFLEIILTWQIQKKILKAPLGPFILIFAVQQYFLYLQVFAAVAHVHYVPRWAPRKREEDEHLYWRLKLGISKMNECCVSSLCQSQWEANQLVCECAVGEIPVSGILLSIIIFQKICSVANFASFLKDINLWHRPFKLQIPKVTTNFFALNLYSTFSTPPFIFPCCSSFDSLVWKWKGFLLTFRLHINRIANSHWLSWDVSSSIFVTFNHIIRFPDPVLPTRNLHSTTESIFS